MDLEITAEGTLNEDVYCRLVALQVPSEIMAASACNVKGIQRRAKRKKKGKQKGNTKASVAS